MELSPDQRRVLETVYQRFVDASLWPTYAVVDHYADAYGIEDPLAVLRTLAPTLVQGIPEAGAPSLEQQLSLSLLGMITVASWNPDARKDLDIFVRSLQAAVTVADRTPPPDVATFDALELLMTLYPHGPEVSVVHRLHGFWSASAGHLWRRLSSDDDRLRWTAELNKQSLRAYRRVQDVPGLAAAERQRIAHHQTIRALGTSAAASQSPAPQPTDRSVRRPGWAELLPEELQDALGSRLHDPGSDTIGAAWIELADLIHRKTGVELDGVALVNQAFGRDAVVRLTPQDSEAGRNLHQGYTELMRELAADAQPARPPRQAQGGVGAASGVSRAHDGRVLRAALGASGSCAVERQPRPRAQPR